MVWAATAGCQLAVAPTRKSVITFSFRYLRERMPLWRSEAIFVTTNAAIDFPRARDFSPRNDIRPAI